mmetsp:Transcript_22082/g.25126  ORF Transcript_22082/g.25126 Transcript_22082/m.25126 type:complete len:367 (+) Transcript_22082:71-1171(+)
MRDWTILSLCVSILVFEHQHFFASAFPPLKTSVVTKDIPNVAATSSVITGTWGDTSLRASIQPAVVAATIALPKVKTIALMALVPTLSSFYRYEYGVSYAYGTATAGTAALILRSLLSSATTNPITQIAQIHAAAIVFYGLRLNLFLLYREIFLERFRLFKEKIEERNVAKEGGTGFLNKVLARTPFVFSCAFLYAGLASPALTSAKIAQMSISAASQTTSVATYAMYLYQALVYLTWFGFGLGAIGDLTKSLVKGKKGPDHLVTGGVYKFFRHPNYTGEMIGWTASFLASIVSVFASSMELSISSLKHIAGPIVVGSLSLVGIMFVLCAATSNLETRQKEKYSDNEEYLNWVQKSWKGLSLSKRK